MISAEQNFQMDEQRSCFLLQRFLEDRMNDEEAAELLALWARHPEWERDAAEHYAVDQLFRVVDRVHQGASTTNGSLPDIEPFFDRKESENVTSTHDELDLERQLISRMLAEVRLEEPFSMDQESAPPLIRAPRPQETARTSAKEQRSWKGFAFALLLLLFFIPLMYQEWTHESTVSDKHIRTPRPFAVVTDSAEVQWQGESVPPQRGEPIYGETIGLQSGWVELLFFNGTRMILHGETDMTLVSGNRVFCNRGRLSVTVPPSGKGFSVQTPHALVTDFGTEFVVDTHPEKTETHVVQGEVEMSRYGTENQRMWTGDAALARSDLVIQRISFDPQRFITHAVMRFQSRMCPTNRKRREQVKGSFRNMPLLEMDFRNRNRTSFPSGVSVETGQYQPGRKEGSSALSFSDRMDHVRFSVPESLDSVTITAWVKLDRLFKEGNPILMSRTEDRGRILWQVAPNGALRFGIRTKNRSIATTYDSPIVVTPDLLGQWIHLGVSVDTKSRIVTHYFNGLPVYRGALSSSTAICIGEADLGNWLFKRQRQKADPIVQWNGAIESVRIDGRVLRAEEIELLYEQ